MKNSFVFVLFIFLFVGCKEVEKVEKCGCPYFDRVLESPYNDPIWHPSGDVIGFNHTPLTKIDYIYGFNCPLQAKYVYDQDSAGFWLINTDGTNQRRILPYTLQNPAWSPDGKWIAFQSNNQVYIMGFDGIQFDTTTVVNITSSGNNFMPVWSNNGKKIAFTGSTYDGKNITNSICILDLETKQIDSTGIYGLYSTWSPILNKIGYLTSNDDKDGKNIGSLIWTYDVTTHTSSLLKTLSLPIFDTRNLRFSPDGTKIGFVSAKMDGSCYKLYTIQSDSTDFKLVSTEFCSNFSWSPDGRIVYLNENYTRIDENKSVLWIMDSDGNNKHQLTYNHTDIIQ